MELHGNVYLTKSRSRAGSISQTCHFDLVVSGPDLETLLSSVFPVLTLDVNLAVLAVFDHFGVLGNRPD